MDHVPLSPYNVAPTSCGSQMVRLCPRTTKAGNHVITIKSGLRLGDNIKQLRTNMSHKLAEIRVLSWLFCMVQQSHELLW